MKNYRWPNHVRRIDLISYLIFIQLTILICRLSFILKRHNNKTNEDINHEESYDDYINEVETGNNWSVVVNGSKVFSIWIDWDIENTKNKEYFSLGYLCIVALEYLRLTWNVYTYFGHPSKVDTTNNVSIAEATWS